ncbi:MAG: SUMF1/EgtB/PvdO family nonheme iron enzyme [Elusimicrobiota bacterium]
MGSSPRYVGMVFVPAGEFVMGADDSFSFEKPEHLEYTKGFYIDVYEVTNGQYKIFLNATGYEPPGHWKNGKFNPGDEKKPVTNINYYDALAYSKWAGKRLPTEEEWEKAARGDKGILFPWGNEWKNNAANVRPFIGFGGLKKVGSFQDGTSPCGCMDIAGNVWEWTSSWFEAYPGNRDSNRNYGTKYKVIRGGSFKSTRSMSRTFSREIFDPALSDVDIGFRCVKD